MVFQFTDAELNNELTFISEFTQLIQVEFCYPCDQHGDLSVVFSLQIK